MVQDCFSLSQQWEKSYWTKRRRASSLPGGLQAAPKPAPTLVPFLLCSFPWILDRCPHHQPFGPYPGAHLLSLSHFHHWKLGCLVFPTDPASDASLRLCVHFAKQQKFIAQVIDHGAAASLHLALSPNSLLPALFSLFSQHTICGVREKEAKKGGF